MDFNFNNYTGHILTERGLRMLLLAVKELLDTAEQSAVVRKVPCMRGIVIDVIINRQGMATKR